MAPAIKLLLYKGIITFAPSPGTATAFTRWQCILLDDSQGNDVVWVGPPPEQRGAYPEVIHLKVRYIKRMLRNGPKALHPGIDCY